MTDNEAAQARAVFQDDLPKGGLHLLAEREEIVGYAHLDTRGDSFGNQVAELVVRPEVRNQGIGGEMLQALAQRAQPLRVWSHLDDPAAARLAAKCGFKRVRELHRMGMDFGPGLGEPVFPGGVAVRTFVPGQDEEAMVAVNARAFSWHPEQGRLTVQDVLATEAEPWFDPAGFFLATDLDGRILGFHWTKVHPDSTGEVYVVGVEPDAQGGGLGKALTLVGLRHLKALGLPRVTLYVESDNTPAIAVYAKLGFTLLDVGVQYER
ncbi:mycothiol synthase [Actinocrispum wychmicini]|uniref:mycothiol synthase n=1 Tax=Actinocrispum wychmicini TaxID=1213861 RepID=UPI002441F20B|nr:mycothiol synthase [Actinocrispum wychmicini]